MSYLCLAIIFEVLGTVLMKMSDGLSNLIPTIAMFVAYFFCFCFAAMALKVLDMGFFYATWSAACIIILGFVGFMFFNENISMVKVLSTALIVVGVIGFNYGGMTH